MRGHIAIITKTESTYVMIESTLRFDDVEIIPGLLLLRVVQRSCMWSRKRSRRRPGNEASMGVRLGAFPLHHNAFTTGHLATRKLYRTVQDVVADRTLDIGQGDSHRQLKSGGMKGGVRTERFHSQGFHCTADGVRAKWGCQMPLTTALHGHCRLSWCFHTLDSAFLAVSGVHPCCYCLCKLFYVKFTSICVDYNFVQKIRFSILAPELINAMVYLLLSAGKILM